MTITVVIPTYNRPDCVRRCIEALAQQMPAPKQIVLIDASIDDKTRRVVEEASKGQVPFEILYRQNSAGRGNTPGSRNIALLEATGEIIAFLDDDAFPRPGWSTALLTSFADSTIAGVAGRALNGVRHEDSISTDNIGRFRSNGTLVGNFNSNPGRCVEVDHMIGCNMAFRAEVIARLGGFRDDMRPGPFGICEETELCIRAKRLGYRLVFNPAACADHIGAPQPTGRRFGPKYSYFHAKNNLVMVIRNYGPGTLAIRHCFAVGWTSAVESVRKILGALARLACTFLGLASGLANGLWFLTKTGTNPIRQGDQAIQLSHNLLHSSRPNRGKADDPAIEQMSGAG